MEIMKSLFTEDYGKYPVTYYMLELLEKRLSTDPEASVKDVFPVVLMKLGYPAPIKEEDILKLVENIGALQEAAQKERPKASSGVTNGTASFGERFLGWVSGLKVDELLLVATNYDYNKAEHYYKNIPCQVVDRVVKMSTQFQWYQMYSQYEAAVMGAGGSFKSKGGEGEPTDETSGSMKEMAQQLKSFGF